MNHSEFLRNLTAFASDVQISTVKSLQAEVDFSLTFTLNAQKDTPEWLENAFQDISGLKDYREVYRQVTEREPSSGIEPDVSFSVKLSIHLDKSGLVPKTVNRRNTNASDSDTSGRQSSTDTKTVKEDTTATFNIEDDTEVVTEPAFLSSIFREDSTEQASKHKPSSSSHEEKSMEKFSKRRSSSTRREDDTKQASLPENSHSRADTLETISRSGDVTLSDVSQLGWDVLHGRFGLKRHDLIEVVRKIKDARYATDPERGRILLDEAKDLAKTRDLSKETSIEKINHLYKEISELEGSGSDDLKDIISKARNLVIKDPRMTDKVLDDVYKIMRLCKYEPKKTKHTWNTWTPSEIDQIEADVDKLGWESYSGHYPLDRSQLVAVLRKIKQAKDTNDLKLKKQYLREAKEIAQFLNSSWSSNSNASEGLNQEESSLHEPEKSELLEASLDESEISELPKSSLDEPDKSELRKSSLDEPEKSELLISSLDEPDKSELLKSSLDRTQKPELPKRSRGKKSTENNNRIVEDEIVDQPMRKELNNGTMEDKSMNRTLSRVSPTRNTSKGSPRGNDNQISRTSTLPSSFFNPTSDDEWRYTGTAYLSEYEPEVYQQFLQRKPELDDALRNLAPEDQLRFSKFERELRWEDEQEYRDIVETAKARGNDDPLATDGEIMLAMKEFTDEKLERFARQLQEERRQQEDMNRRKREKQAKRTKSTPKLGHWATVGEIRAAMTPAERERKRVEEEEYFRREHEYLQRLKTREDEELAKRYVQAQPPVAKSSKKKSTNGLTYKEIRESKTKEEMEQERRNLEIVRCQMAEQFGKLQRQRDNEFRARFPGRYAGATAVRKGRVGRLADRFEKGGQFSTISDATNEEPSMSRHRSWNTPPVLIQSKRSVVSDERESDTSKRHKGTPRSSVSEITNVVQPRLDQRSYVNGTPRKRLTFSLGEQITPPRSSSPLPSRASTNLMRKKLIDQERPVFPRTLFAGPRELPSRRYSDGAVTRRRRSQRLESAPERLQKSRNLFNTSVSWGELDDEDEVFLWNSDDFETNESVFDDNLSPRSGHYGTPNRRDSRKSSSVKSTNDPIAGFVPYRASEDTVWETEAELGENIYSHVPKSSLTSTPKRGNNRRRSPADPGLSFVDWKKAQSPLENDDFTIHDEYSMFWGL